VGAVFMLSNASKPFGGRALIDRLRHLTENVPMDAIDALSPCVPSLVVILGLESRDPWGLLMGSTD